MPSHSKKQHNFMEAIAHSPSFAKKAGVPQSVGKDYAAADKGKTFGKGGEMKESKGMVGKEVAFMKKKGAPKSMIKHEMAEMKRGGKVRRMAGGGMGDEDVDMSMGYGAALSKPRDYDKEKAQGAENLKRIKGFFGFGDSSDEGERKPTGEQRKTVTPASYPTPKDRTIPPVEGSRTPSGPQRKISSDEAQTPTFSGVGSFEDNYEPQRGPKVTTGASGFGQTPYKDSGFSALNKSPAKRSKPVGIEKTVKKERVITEPVDTSYDSLESRRASKKPTETPVQSKRKIGMASDETREAVRKGLGSALDFFNLSKRHEQEFGKKYAKGGNVKKMAFGGDTGQPMRGAAPMKPAPRVPLLNPNRPGLSDLAKQKMGDYNQGMLGRIAASKKMAEGGVARADGIAKKGKTEGKMVKMAAGGFVKSADGCAQRGKTKGAQVKMNRGGMC